MTVAIDNTGAKARKLMKEAYGLHIHPNPSHFTRVFQFAHDCDEYGMAGAILKSHYDSTASRTFVITTMAPK